MCGGMFLDSVLSVISIKVGYYDNIVVGENQCVVNSKLEILVDNISEIGVMVALSLWSMIVTLVLSLLIRPIDRFCLLNASSIFHAAVRLRSILLS